MTEYLSIAEVLAIHKDQIACDGDAGLGDPGQLEATLFGPHTGY